MNNSIFRCLARKQVFLIAQLFSFAAVAVALCILPGAPVAESLAGFIAVWFFVSVIYSCNPDKGMCGWWILLAVTLLLSMGIVANMYLFTLPEGADSVHPVLMNNDSNLMWQRAMMLTGHEYDPGIASPDGPFGASLFVALVVSIFGPDLIYPLLVNELCVLLSIVMTGMLCARLRIAGGATMSMLFLSMIAYFVCSGAILLKDAPLSAAVTSLMLFYTFISRPSKRQGWNIVAGIGFLLSVIVMSLCRPAMLLVAGSFMAAMAIGRCTLRQYAAVACLVAAFVIIYLLMLKVDYGINVNVKRMAFIHFSEEIRNDIWEFVESTQRPYDSIRTMVSASLWSRIAFLPLSCALQFIIPLPWNCMAHASMGYTLIYAHMGFGWYLTAGFAAYGYLFGLRRMSPLLHRMAVWGILIWVIIAFMYDGTISRYCLPFMGIWAAMAAWVVSTGNVRSRRFIIFAVIYSALIFTVLAISYFYIRFGW